MLALTHSLLVVTPSLFAGTRAAIVIGNSNYRSVERCPTRCGTRPLPQGHWGTRISIPSSCLTWAAMRSSLHGRNSSKKAKVPNVALLYFTAHRLSIGGANYAPPVDAGVAHNGDVKLEAAELDTLRDIVARARSGSSSLWSPAVTIHSSRRCSLPTARIAQPRVGSPNRRCAAWRGRLPFG